MIRLPYPDVDIDPSRVVSLSVGQDTVVDIVLVSGLDSTVTIRTFWSPEIDELIVAMSRA